MNIRPTPTSRRKWTLAAIVAVCCIIPPLLWLQQEQERRAHSDTSRMTETPYPNPESATVLQVVREEREHLHADGKRDQPRTITDYAEASVFPGNPHGAGIGDEIAAEISNTCRKLRIIHNGNRSSLTDLGLSKLADLPELKVLILGHSAVTAKGLQDFRIRNPQCVVRVFPRKVTYSLGDRFEFDRYQADVGIHLSVYPDGQLVDEDVRAISTFQEMQYFWAAPDTSEPRPTKHAYRLSDKTMKVLSSMPQLRAITIWPAPEITDQGLSYLHGHPSLTYLSISDSAITEDGFRSFRKAMPNCELHRNMGL